MHYSNNISMEVTDYKYGGYWEQDGSEELNSNGILFNVANNISPTFVPVNPDGTTFVYSNASSSPTRRSPADAAAYSPTDATRTRARTTTTSSPTG